MKRTPGGVVTGVTPRQPRLGRRWRERNFPKTALEDVEEAERLIREAADHLAIVGRYRRAGKLVRLASRVETAAMYLADELEFSKEKK